MEWSDDYYRLCKTNAELRLRVAIDQSDFLTELNRATQ